MPRKTCQLRLSQNLTKFYVLVSFHETIPTVKSVSSSEILRINYGFLTEINNFVIEITILPFFQKLEFLDSYISFAAHFRSLLNELGLWNMDLIDELVSITMVLMSI